MEQINNNKHKNIDSKRTGKDTMYSITKSDYDKFVAKIEKTDFKNAYTRYLSERAFLINILKYAREENLEKEASDILSRLEQVEEELLKRGIKLPIEYK